MTSLCDYSTNSATRHRPNRSLTRRARRVVFLGDLVDRGPGVAEVLDLVMSMVAAGSALCILGNHENKLNRALAGRRVQVTHGLAESLEQLERRGP